MDFFNDCLVYKEAFMTINIYTRLMDIFFPIHVVLEKKGVWLSCPLVLVESPSRALK